MVKAARSVTFTLPVLPQGFLTSGAKIMKAGIDGNMERCGNTIFREDYIQNRERFIYLHPL